MKHNNDHKLKNFLEDIGEEDIYIANGLSDAFIGIANVKNNRVAVYSTGLIALQLMEDGMSYDEAEEYIQFNIIGLDVGDKTPIYVDFIPDAFWKED